MQQGFNSAAQGAATPLYLAFDPNISIQQSGCYFVDRKATNCKFMLDKAKVEKLWSICSKL
jgi:hypothetical protein